MGDSNMTLGQRAYKKFIAAEPEAWPPWEAMTVEGRNNWDSTAVEVVKEHERSKLGHVRGLNFGDAIQRMRMGHAVTREKWNGPNQWIALQTPNENSKMLRPYIYISPVDGQLVPWLASQTDMLESDYVDLGPVIELLNDGKTAAA